MVDTFAKFDAILICHSKAITRPVLPLAGTLIGTIVMLIMDFFQNVIFMLFCYNICHFLPPKSRKMLFIGKFCLITMKSTLITDIDLQKL